MARQLEARLEELERERARLQEAIRRVGESFAANLDRDALLEIVVQTAVDGVGAAVGRATDARAGPAARWTSVARVGDLAALRPRAATPPRRRCMRAPARSRRSRAPAASRARRAAARRRGAAHRVLGLVSVARAAPRLHRRRARAVQLPRQPGRGVDRERRPARDRAAPGGHRRADRPVQPPPLPGGDRDRGRARPPLRPAARADHARHRRLQARQRHATATSRATMVLREVARVLRRLLARDRRARALRRRGDGGRAAADRPRRRLPVRRARARRGSRRSSCRCSAGDGVLRVTASFGVAALPPRPRRTRTRWSPRPTPRSTGPSGSGKNRDRCKAG